MSGDIIDPVDFYHVCWPEGVLYQKQVEILRSVVTNQETVVVAGNGLGKDYISAVLALYWMCSRRPARAVTTSVKSDQLDDVLWGEIRHLLSIADLHLPLHYNHLHIRQRYNDGRFVPKCELVGQCVGKGESLLGRHLPQDIPRTLVIYDEASGIDTEVYTRAATWTHRTLIIGNPFPCENFFRKAVETGDIPSPVGTHLKQHVIRIKAEDSPNIQMAFKQILEGIRRPELALVRTPERPWGIYSQDKFEQLDTAWCKSGLDNPPLPMLVPGLIGLHDYIDRRILWDPMLQCISLDGNFYEGAEILMFPPSWLNAAETHAMALSSERRYGRRTIGVDTAEGGAKTVYAVIDEQGLLDLRSKRTPDTSIIVGEVIALMQEFNVAPEDVLFDLGGGGKEHSDTLRAKGYGVRGVGFGESVKPERRHGLTPLVTKKLQDELRYTYKNRRAEMYAILRGRFNPIANPAGFAMSVRYTELRHQLSKIPMRFDGEGRLVLPPKHRKDADSTETTLTELIGHSPDEADALVLASYGLAHKALVRHAGAVKL